MLPERALRVDLLIEEFLQNLLSVISENLRFVLEGFWMGVWHVDIEGLEMRLGDNVGGVTGAFVELVVV